MTERVSSNGIVLPSTFLNAITNGQGGVLLAFPRDRYEIFAFGAEARSQAVGVLATGGVFGGNEVNLNTLHGFGVTRPWHSGQFVSFLGNDRRGYWQQLMFSIGLTPNP